MEKYPVHYYYTTYHYWLRPSGDIFYVGVTPNFIDKRYEVFAAEFERFNGFVYQKDQVGVFSAQAPGEEFGDQFCFRAPLSGHILRCNDRFSWEPDVWRDNPYIGGWLFQMELENQEELKTLMNAEAYTEFVDRLLRS